MVPRRNTKKYLAGTVNQHRTTSTLRTYHTTHIHTRTHRYMPPPTLHVPRIHVPAAGSHGPRHRHRHPHPLGHHSPQSDPPRPAPTRPMQVPAQAHVAALPALPALQVAAAGGCTAPCAAAPRWAAATADRVHATTTATRAAATVTVAQWHRRGVAWRPLACIARPWRCAASVCLHCTGVRTVRRHSESGGQWQSQRRVMSLSPHSGPGMHARRSTSCTCCGVSLAPNGGTGNHIEALRPKPKTKNQKTLKRTFFIEVQQPVWSSGMIRP